MKFSASIEYGLMGVGYIATHFKEGNVLAQKIAKEYDIPLEYLLKILEQLVRAGILNSKRGPKGGFTMGKALDQITLLDIFEAIDKPLSVANLFDMTHNEQFISRMEKVCQEAINERNNVLKSVALADLVGNKKK